MIKKPLWLAFVLLCIALFALPAFAAPQKISRTRINDTDYVSFSDWARANDLGWGWIKRDETLYATNRTTKLLLVVDSREARVNNVDVWLLFPLATRSGRVFISQLDVDTTLRPLLFPPRNESGKQVKTICIDPGHGGNDPGFRVGSQNEKDYTLRLANELRTQLKKAGFKVSLTRTRDKRIELSDRPAIAKQRNADLFISLHFNATETGRNEVKGAETYALTPAGARSTGAGGAGELGGWHAGNKFNEENQLLAWDIHKSLVQRLTVEDRGVKRARFQVLREASMPAVLIEGGFMSHPSEGRKIFDAAYRREMATAIVGGILAYKRAVERMD